MDLFSIQEIIKGEFIQTPKEWIDLNVSPSGLINITVVSQAFKGKTTDERKKMILSLLPQNIKNRLGFISIYSVEEAELLELKATQQNNFDLNSWFDLANSAINKVKDNRINKNLKNPKTVSFYSFKGGIGRTTGLAHTAWILAMRGRKVLIIDLDLEAPGLHLIFPKLTPKPKYGIVDYFYERYYAPNGEKFIHIAEMLGEVPVENASGRLFIVPAGKVSLDYMAKVDDLRAVALGNSDLWGNFIDEVSHHIQPDIILVDSRTGINEWGAFSLLRVADEIIYFLYPNEENMQGAESILNALQQIEGPLVHLIFSKIPDKLGKSQVQEVWPKLKKLISSDLTNDELDTEDDFEDPIIIHYNPDIAVSNSYPVEHLLPVFAPIANLIDEVTEQSQLKLVLSGTDRWPIIKSLKFTTIDAKDEKNDLSKIFQKTSDFDKFIDDTTSVVRGQKGTGKTALYWMMLKHEDQVRKLARGRLDHIESISAHGSFRHRPGKEEFRYLAEQLSNHGTWESYWRGYALVRLHMEGKLILRKAKFKPLRDELKGINKNNPNQPWTKKHTELLLKIATDTNLSLLAKDAFLDINEQMKDKATTIWFLYDDLDEDIQEDSTYQNDVLSGLFYLIQASDSQRLSHIKFKVLIREDIWDRLNFTNKSHFNGRDVILKWTRIDFLRLALRQAMQSSEYINIMNRYAPIQDLDNATEEKLLESLQILWGIRRERNRKSKYVARWVYERLTDSTGTTFPRSLGILLQAAKEHELQYEYQTYIPSPTDRLLRSQSLNEGLIKASEKRCQELRQEYPELEPLFNRLSTLKDICDEEEIRDLYNNVSIPYINSFEDFVRKLKNIGLIYEDTNRKDKKLQYRFADLYVHGFELKRTPRKF